MPCFVNSGRSYIVVAYSTRIYDVYVDVLPGQVYSMPVQQSLKIWQVASHQQAIDEI